MKETKRTRRHWVVKHSSGFCATGKMMKRWKQQLSSKCPRCDEPVEDELHVWRCQGEGAADIWLESIRKLRSWMMKSKTLPNLTAIICDRLTAWRNTSSPVVQVSYFLGLRDTVNAQEKVGWRSFLEGFPVRGWAEVQQRYYEWIRCKNSGERWLASLIQKVWDVAWDMWDHRNSVLHGNESSLLLLQLRRGIEEQFELGSSSVTKDAKLLVRPGREKILAGNAAMQ